MSWQDQLSGDSLSWLLESEDPAIHYLAMRDLLDLAPGDSELQLARARAHQAGSIAAVLQAMQPEGYWEKPGAGYNPKYTSTVWTITLLAQLGALVTEDRRIAAACTYVMDHSLAAGGQFSINGAPSGTIDCLQGNLGWALLEMGCQDTRLPGAFEWMARTVTGEGMAPRTEKKAPLRYFAYKTGPLFACGANNYLSCAWGAAKVMLALGRLPATDRTPLIERAIQQGIDFLFSVDPVSAAYPVDLGAKPSRDWWKFGFPVFYITDVLQIAEVLAALGYAHDPRLAGTLELIRQKQDVNGRWALDYDYHGKTLIDFGTPKQPNPWVTLRALRVLKQGLSRNTP